MNTRRLQTKTGIIVTDPVFTSTTTPHSALLHISNVIMDKISFSSSCDKITCFSLCEATNQTSKLHDEL